MELIGSLLWLALYAVAAPLVAWWVGVCGGAVVVGYQSVMRAARSARHGEP